MRSLSLVGSTPPGVAPCATKYRAYSRRGTRTGWMPGGQQKLYPAAWRIANRMGVGQTRWGSEFRVLLLTVGIVRGKGSGS